MKPFNGAHLDIRKEGKGKLHGRQIAVSSQVTLGLTPLHRSSRPELDMATQLRQSYTSFVDMFEKYVN